MHTAVLHTDTIGHLQYYDYTTLIRVQNCTLIFWKFVTDKHHLPCSVCNLLNKLKHEIGTHYADIKNESETRWWLFLVHKMCCSMTNQKFMWSCAAWETVCPSSHVLTVWADHVPAVASKQSWLIITDELVAQELVEPHYYAAWVKQREIAVLCKTTFSPKNKNNGSMIKQVLH